ncbi:flagellar biosynthesis protein FlaG [Pseudomonas sp. S04]|uniref:flagellar protein FlaG n=1 Tax=unclassified Pseudomonas TaxID=196821 RepID=UPI0013203C96|nr:MULTISPECIES: flagellar protein FlaG [unclassified Pseudomonas]QHD00220.1 flagellar biosynthesis protein FlaG [Pseudomonas sp. S04]QHF32703.1 flagellar biosynthesis protein FlaG [Pseudomonas sp. S19]
MDMSIKLSASYPNGLAQASGGPAHQAAPAVTVTQESSEEPQRLALEKAVTDIREFVQATQRNLNFSIDDSTGQVVVKVIATDSGEVIRQIPSETALKLAQNLSDAGSLLFQTQV